MRTSLYSILCIAIRLAAVLLAVHTLAGVPGAYNLVSHGDWSDDRWMIGALYLAVLLFAFLLWVYPSVLARLAAGKASQQTFESAIDAAELQWIAFSVAGLWIFFEALSGLTYDGVRELVLRHAVRVNNQGLDVSPSDEQLVASLVANVIQLVLGFVLVMGARGLVDLLRRLRFAGQPAVSNND
jgi:hypothetical protein